MILSEKVILLILFFISVSLLAPPISAYKMEPGSEVHQHMTKEAEKIWKQIPYQKGFNKE